MEMPGSSIVWNGDVPVSVRFGEGYFSSAGGEAETRAIFLAGNGLPDRWRFYNSDLPFRIGELGFGTGLNFRVVESVWREFWKGNEPIFDLVFESVEGFPLSASDMQRVGWAWDWETSQPEFYLEFPNRVKLRVHFRDVSEFLSEGFSPCHAWFLDGFSPARNPAMWTPSVLEAVAAKSLPGTTLATYSAAGFVRRGLETAGFTMTKRPGFGLKRESLSGVRNST